MSLNGPHQQTGNVLIFHASSRFMAYPNRSRTRLMRMTRVWARHCFQQISNSVTWLLHLPSNNVDVLVEVTHQSPVKRPTFSPEF